MTQFFSKYTERKTKFSYLDLKSWVTGGTKIQPNFLGQNNSIFTLSAPIEKLSHFDLKSCHWRN